MNKKYILPFLFLISLLNRGCFKEIDTEPIPLPEVEDYFIVQYSIKQIQSFYRFYESTVVEIDTAKSSSWDLAFESAGEGSRVLLGWASFSTGIPSGKFSFEEISQDLILDLIDTGDWLFDDPTFVNNIDSLALTNHWENGEIWIQNRGVTSDNYYAIQFVSSDDESYTFRYASAQSLGEVKEATVYRASAFNYVYFSFNSHKVLTIEPDYREWDILCTPYRGWWETDTPGIYSPFNMSGIMINNEAGVRVAQVFDPEVSFDELDFASVYEYEFTDKKGAIGADWKVLGGVNSGNIFSVDKDKKYLMKKTIEESGEVLYFKMQIIDYKNEDGEDHYPTIEFKYLGSE
jgi:hypothetical protein